jgi:hypothetical protein
MQLPTFIWTHSGLNARIDSISLGPVLLPELQSRHNELICIEDRRTSQCNASASQGVKKRTPTHEEQARAEDHPLLFDVLAKLKSHSSYSSLKNLSAGQTASPLVEARSK